MVGGSILLAVLALGAGALRLYTAVRLRLAALDIEKIQIPAQVRAAQDLLVTIKLSGWPSTLAWGRVSLRFLCTASLQHEHQVAFVERPMADVEIFVPANGEPGRHYFGGLVLSVSGPFGILTLSRAHDFRAEVEILPASEKLEKSRGSASA